MKQYTLLVAALVLAACGGGGGGADAQLAPPANTQASASGTGTPASTADSQAQAGGDGTGAAAAGASPASASSTGSAGDTGTSTSSPGSAAGPGNDTSVGQGPSDGAGSGGTGSGGTGSAASVPIDDSAPDTTATWQPGMPRPHPLDPNTTEADMHAYNAWCATQPAGSCYPFFQPRPDVATASLDEINQWNAHCATARCHIDLPPRSGRSLNWWGTDPREIERVEDQCLADGGTMETCAIPDGDKLVWNFSCEPQPTCRIRLSRPY